MRGVKNYWILAKLSLLFLWIGTQMCAHGTSHTSVLYMQLLGASCTLTLCTERVEQLSHIYAVYFRKQTIVIWENSLQMRRVIKTLSLACFFNEVVCLPPITIRRCIS